VTDTDAPASIASAAATRGRKKTTARRRRAPRKRAPARRAASSPRPRGAGALQSLLSGLSRQANFAGGRIAALSGEGVSRAKRTLGKASAASKKKIDQLTREWKQMDTAKRAGFVAALLAALAAASAPIVGSRLKKK
jgi:hypothetical protein